MLLNGYNPYLYLPQDFLLNQYTPPNQAEILITGMQELNASHYSNYPPLNQFNFLISNLFSDNNILLNIITLRLQIILADIGIFYFGRKLLSQLNCNPKLIFLYLLNPFIIIELTGNLHFEAVMIFFLIWSLHLFLKNKWKSSSVVMAGAIATKLLPLLFLPLFYKRIAFKKLVLFYILIGIICISLFLPFLSKDVVYNYSNSVGLWFGQFQFNGSLHNLITYITKHFNIYYTTKILGKITPILVFIYISYLGIKKHSIALITTMLFSLSFYLFTASTVHPWYVAMLVVLSLFTPYRFPLVWSFTIMLGYSFYQNNDFTHNYPILIVQYTAVIGYFIYEHRKLKHLDQN